MKPRKSIRKTAATLRPQKLADLQRHPHHQPDTSDIPEVQLTGTGESHRNRKRLKPYETEKPTSTTKNKQYDFSQGVRGKYAARYAGMTPSLFKAFTKAAVLSAPLQNLLAAELRAVIADERRWDKTFAKSADALDTLAKRARRKHKQGKTILKGIDEI